jgi:hypothetical protein
VKIEDVSNGDTQTELEQGDGDPELDREHAGEQDYGGEDRGELDGLHG